MRNKKKIKKKKYKPLALTKVWHFSEDLASPHVLSKGYNFFFVPSCHQARKWAGMFLSTDPSSPATHDMWWSPLALWVPLHLFSVTISIQLPDPTCFRTHVMRPFWGWLLVHDFKSPSKVQRGMVLMVHCVHTNLLGWSWALFFQETVTRGLAGSRRCSWPG